MRITDQRKSLETCTESGWDAVDLFTDEPINSIFIERLRSVEGSFTYMKMLKRPFFKLEYHDYVIKGVEGNAFFRMAFHKDSVSKVKQIVTLLNEERD